MMSVVGEFVFLINWLDIIFQIPLHTKYFYKTDSKPHTRSMHPKVVIRAIRGQPQPTRKSTKTENARRL